jgi:hypothetical protein
MQKSTRPMTIKTSAVRSLFWLLFLIVAAPVVRSAPATLLFEDDFNRGIPGWTAVQPVGGNYLDGPMLWQYDIVSNAFVEQSNVYTDSATYSVTRIATMLINDTIAPTNFTYKARLTAGDDDAFGLIWGFQSEDTFYRAAFARQARTVGWPFAGWTVERFNKGQIQDLYGAGTFNFVPSFVNTANRPFDVTIAVTNNLLTFTLVDDPDGAATVYNLVNREPLQGSTGGRVGMFTWGQSGATPGGFRIAPQSLAPTPLSGNPNQLTNWTFLVTPRSDGTTNLTSGGGPVWSLGYGPNGNMGTLIENADTFGDNVVTGTTNFAASSLVAGNVNWSNYVYSARLISNDDDGFGMLIRFADERNFYRIAFRNQNSTAGVKRGISIQKSVDLVFSEIFSSTSFIPPISVPIDVYASIRGSRLQVIVVSNPDSSAAQRFYFGPPDITDGTVDKGKIGLFSWAEYNVAGARNRAGLEVDSVKVQEVTGEGLIVASPFGAPNPPVGLNDMASGAVVTASVTNLVLVQPGVRQVLVGWDGSGSVPPSGTNSQVTFTLSTFSLINWKWRTEFSLTTNAVGGGRVSASGGPWIAETTNVTVTATPNPGNIFVGWTGASVTTSSNLSFSMTQPVTLTAIFAVDSDSDGLADSWETANFGNLAQTAAGDPDNDGVPNSIEYTRGTNPNSAESLLATDGLTSQWINTQRDPVLPGQLYVTDFGSGFRGAFDTSNDNRFANDAGFVTATNLADFASFQSPIVVIRTNLWNPAWSTNFSATMEFAVGDNDGNCVYFRYIDELNWYRVTVCGEPETTARPRQGVSIQSRVKGKFAEVPISAAGPFIFTDPLDTSGYKRVRVTVGATNQNFEVRVIGWNVYLATPGYDPASEQVLTFTDTNLLTGRIGFGIWGQGDFGSPNATNGVPITSGAFVDNIVVSSRGTNVFTENWETAALSNQLPAGWSNPYPASNPASGDWRVSAHGTITQQSNYAPATTGTLLQPKADADGAVLLAPPPGAANYFLEIGLHPFDDDGIGFVYDFTDTNNYSRVLFVSEPSGNGRVPQGLSVSRKFNGVWSDIIVGDRALVYQNGQPIAVEFSNNNGEFKLAARPIDNPSSVTTWSWTAPAASATNRFGLTTWGEQDAHFLYARAYSLQPRVVAGELRIGKASIAGGNLVLEISNPGGSPYTVETSTTLASGSWSVVASNQTGAQWTTALRTGAGPVFYRLRR